MPATTPDQEGKSMVKAIEFSENARCLLGRRLGGERVEVTPRTLESYREGLAPKLRFDP